MCIVNKHTHKNVHKNVHINLCILPVDHTQIFVYNAVTRSRTTDLQQNNFIIKEVVIMCMTKKELEEKIEEVRKYKAMAEEASNIQKALEQEIISYMNENNLTEEFTDSAKITYKEQTRATLDKKRLEEDLGDLSEYEKVTSYKVLRIK